MSSKRLVVLEKMTSAGSTDPFVWYGLAMEYRGLERVEDALATFGKLKALDPSYVPMYLMCATLLLSHSRAEEARTWLHEGIAVAKGKGDAHAVSELEDALGRAE